MRAFPSTTTNKTTEAKPIKIGSARCARAHKESPACTLIDEPLIVVCVVCLPSANALHPLVAQVLAHVCVLLVAQKTTSTTTTTTLCTCQRIRPNGHCCCLYSISSCARARDKLCMLARRRKPVAAPPQTRDSYSNKASRVRPRASSHAICHLARARYTMRLRMPHTGVQIKSKLATSHTLL